MYLVLGESWRVFWATWVLILLGVNKLRGFVWDLYIMRQRGVCVHVCVHKCGGWEDKEDAGKTSGTVKEKKNVLYRRKEKLYSPANCNTYEES